MGYHLDFTDKAKADIAAHKKAGNKALLNKLLKLLEELAGHPFTGIGKPEPLKHNLIGYWSRRINKDTDWCTRFQKTKSLSFRLKVIIEGVIKHNLLEKCIKTKYICKMNMKVFL